MSNKRNSVETSKLQVTIDVETSRIIEEMITLGIHGANKSEVASWILRMWIWESQTKLNNNGIKIKKEE
jgi:hypothetical protein